ncbi:11420_t:CDS:2, partial [Gigaspora margarita]
NEALELSVKMHIHNYPPVFTICIKYIESKSSEFLEYYKYKANVTIHTTGELLSKSFEEFFNLDCEYKGISQCAFRPNRKLDTLPYKYELMYNDKHIQKTDTIEKLGIKEGDWIEVNKRTIEICQICVKTSTQKIINLQVSGSDTVYSLKEMIQNKESYYIDQQRLIFAGKFLDDECLISDYCLKKGSTLHLLLIQKGLIHIEMPKGKTLELEVYYDVTVDTLRKLIQAKEDIPNDKFYLSFSLKTQRNLSFRHKSIISEKETEEIDETLLNYKIQLNYYSPLISIYVKQFNGKIITLDIFWNDTMKTQSRIRQQSTILLLLKNKPVKESSEEKFSAGQIYVKTPSQEEIVLEVSKNNTVITIKQMINKVSNYHHEYILIFEGMILENEYTLADYDIKLESTLNIIYINNNTEERYFIFVKTYVTAERTISLCVYSNYFIYQIKQMIQEKEGYTPNQLIFAGEELKDDYTLSDYCIQKESTLYSILRLRGGMFHETSCRLEFDALPSLTHYVPMHEEILQSEVHINIACDYCGKKCPDYDLCCNCISMSKLLHNGQHTFVKILIPPSSNNDLKNIPPHSVTIHPILPTTKEEMLTLLQKEEQQRLSPEIQKQYHKVGSDPTLGMDWMDITDKMQYNLVRESGNSDEAVQLLRRAPQLYKNDPAFQTTQVYVRNNIANLGNLTEEMMAPNCQLVPLEPTTEISNTNVLTTISLYSLYQKGKPLVLLGGSYTCPLFRYISHVLNDIYSKYKAQVDFYMIQIREAHASDVWPIGNVVDVKEHRTLTVRLSAAREMIKATKLEIPVLADTMDNTFLKLYSPWPFRFFVIVDGILKLVRMPKEARYDTTDLVECLDTLLNGNKNKRRKLNDC